MMPDNVFDCKQISPFDPEQFTGKSSFNAKSFQELGESPNSCASRQYLRTSLLRICMSN
jgi:hypothetical protein